VVATDTVAAIRAWAAERHLPEAHLARWLKMPEHDRAALLAIARTLRLSTGAIVTALATLQEISMRESCAIESVLARDPIARTTKSRTASAPARAKAFLEALKQIRYPRLAEASRELEAKIAALDLPRGISIVLPKDLASDELRVEIEANDGAGLKRLIAALHASADKLAEIADRLGGEK
jgi:hypothetical protein